MRKQIAAANWKMNLTLQEANDLLDEIVEKNIQLSEDQLAIFAVPFPYLLLANDKLKNSKRLFCSCSKLLYKRIGRLYR